MSPYTVTFRNSVRKDDKEFAFLYDAKNYLANRFIEEAEFILSQGKQADFNIFISLPSGLRANVPSFVFNSTTVLEVSNMIRNASGSMFIESEGANKLTVHIRNTSISKLDQDLLFTLSYNQNYDNE